MVAMTFQAFAALQPIERFLVRTLLKELGLTAVTLPANVGYRRQTGRYGAMITMAVVTRRCREVVLLVKGFGVNAVLVLRKLIGRDIVPLHMLAAGVTLCARFRDIQRKYGGLRIPRCPYTVNAVAADACRHLRIAAPQTRAVNARRVFLYLVDSKRGVELLHQRRVAMTLSAECRYLHRSGFSNIAAGGILCRLFVALGRIPSVAIHTRKAAGFMNVLIEKLGRFRQALVGQSGVTLDAGARCLRRARC